MLLRRTPVLGWSALLSLGLLAGCGTGAGAASQAGASGATLAAGEPRGGASVQRVILLHENDPHFHDNFRSEVDAYISGIRGGEDPVYLLSAGDLLVRNEDRWPEGADMAWYEATGRRMMERGNQLGYDVATFGNHELDLKFDGDRNVTRELLASARFPWLAANLEAQPEHLPSWEPYHVLGADQGGPSIAVLGLTVINFDPVPGMSQQDFHETTERFLHLAETHDALVLLTHIGIRYDLELANAFPEVAAVLGGHTNTLLPEAVHVNGVLVGQAGGNGHVNDPSREAFLGITVLEFEDMVLARTCGWVVRIGPDGTRLASDAASGPPRDPSAPPRCAA